MGALLASLACLALNAFFVAAEFALVKVRLSRLEARARAGERRAKSALEVTRRLDRYLSVSQFGITLASLGLGWIGEPAIERFADAIAIRLTGEALGHAGHIAVDVVGLGLLTSVHLLVGELVPKFVAIRHAEATMLASALPLRLVDRAFRPLLFVLERAQNALLSLLGIDPHEVTEHEHIDEAELLAILSAPGNKDEQRIASRVLRLSRQPVRALMVPRVDVFAMDVTTPGDKALAELRAQGFSRVLLVESGSLDEVVGYLYAKDLLFDEQAARRPNLRDIARRVLFVPGGRTGLDAMREMQRARAQLAVVVDEYGGTAGIVTLEDLVEAFVGAIRDELDVEHERIIEVVGEPRTWLVDARATGDELRERGVPVADDVAGESVGRMVVEALGRLPKVGDVVAIADGIFAEVVAMSNRRIRRLRVGFRGSAAAAPS